ncbi:uncharacterized protein LOC116169091 [Photinus pyralis]|uniref:uncharacterized protein LOC116169091 n=1 Tax=Photinus pyralis TaxID=7054 RepID=UPI00126766E4|nr:uncharacterized protein LOC116169091 [Photinus pyralis]
MTREQTQLFEINNAVAGAVKGLLEDGDFFNKLVTSISEKIFEKLKTYVDEKVWEKTTVLNRKLDNLEQYTRRNNILIFGVREEDNEVLTDKVISLLNTRMGVKLDKGDIDRLHRFGKFGDKPRPIIIKFKGYEPKQAIIRKRKLLKGTPVVIKEDLTKERLSLFRELLSKVGNKNCWSRDGKLYCKINNQIRLITTDADLNDVPKFN